MGVIASQITSLTSVYSTVYSDSDQRKHHSSASLAFVRGIHRWPVNSLHKGPVTGKTFPFDDVIMKAVSRVFVISHDFMIRRSDSWWIKALKFWTVVDNFFWWVKLIMCTHSFVLWCKTVKIFGGTAPVKCHPLIARFMGPSWGPRWAPCWPHEPSYLGTVEVVAAVPT